MGIQITLAKFNGEEFEWTKEGLEFTKRANSKRKTKKFRLYRGQTYGMLLNKLKKLPKEELKKQVIVVDEIELEPYYGIFKTRNWKTHAPVISIKFRK